jgi:putative SOS response-associated peptidase YedK
MCNLYSITTNQAAIIALFRVINPYVGNLPPMTGVFPDYPAPVVRNAEGEREMVRPDRYRSLQRSDTKLVAVRSLRVAHLS